MCDVLAARAVVRFDPDRPALRRHPGSLLGNDIADAGSAVRGQAESVDFETEKTELDRRNEGHDSSSRTTSRELVCFNCDQTRRMGRSQDPVAPVIFSGSAMKRPSHIPSLATSSRLRFSMRWTPDSTNIAAWVVTAGSSNGSGSGPAVLVPGPAIPAF